ncbi:DUF1699 family protein [Methanomethylovorans sp.]|uniref:DUF1699 family protein n=1 Tax=Methanomethylovorans sp. TaxID=2758717 RepID=UPI00351C5195
MKIKVINSGEEIDSLGANEQIVHLAFRPSDTDILSLITKCPGLKALLLPSFKKTISKSTQILLEMKGITLLDGVWGHRKATLAERMASQEPDLNGKNVWSHEKCINEYSESIYDRIDQYRAEGLSNEEIEEKMSGELHMGPDLARFFLKNKK